MFSPLYPKLAWTTMIRNRRMTFPFVLGLSAMTAIFYAITSLAAIPDLENIYGGDTVKMILQLGKGVIFFLLPILYFYVNGFVARSRGKEMGLFTTLGMERRHLVMILFWQMLYLFAASSLLGLLFGFLVEKLSWLLLQNLLGSLSDFNLHVSLTDIGHTLLYTGLVYLALFIYTAWTTVRKDPLEQLKSESQTETPPKVRWVLAVAALLFLGAGYAMAVTIKDPVNAMVLFFVAVIFVIIGTYLFFLFGITVVLHLLKNRQGYYYDPKHFFSVSNLQFRIKSNSASLATICILSTMILVTMTATISVSNIVDMVSIPAGRQMSISSYIETLEAAPERFDAMKQIIASADPSNETDIVTLLVKGSQSYVTAISASDAQALSKTPLDLPDKAVLYDPEGMMDAGTEEFQVEDLAIPVVYENTRPPVYWNNAYAVYMICPDETFAQLGAAAQSSYSATVLFDSPQAAKGRQLEDEIVRQAGNPGFYYTVSSAASMRESMLAMTGGLLFIGVFVSMIIFVALVLVLYYRQISEGYSDQKRFEIMQNLGMEKKQVMGLINSQAVLMFFLPLGTAAIHLLFASGFLKTMLVAGFGIPSSLYWTSVLVVLASYALIYIVVYRITAKTYYSIVRKAESA